MPAEAVERLERAKKSGRSSTDALEAIILPKERPVVDVVDGSYTAPAAPFAHLDQPAARATIEAAIPAIGRIELPDHPVAALRRHRLLCGRREPADCR